MRTLRRNTPWMIVTLVVVGVLIALWSALGLGIHKIDSGSMEPALPVGSRVIVASTDDLSVGDVVAFQYDGQVVVHRLIGYADDGSLNTRGDANDSADGWKLEQSDIIGRVVTYFPQYAPSFWTSTRAVGSLVLFGVSVLALTLLMKDEEEDTPSEETRTPSPA